MPDTLSIGRRGEQAAAEYLASNGFKVLHRNWRAGRYELDIVARRGGTLHFVEVKSRKASPLTMPEEALTRAKFQSLCHAARAYLAAYPCDLEVQFDLAAVDILPDRCRVRYIPAAMSPRW